MSDLNKKVDYAIKILKLAEADALNREEADVSIPRVLKICGGGENQLVTQKQVEISYSSGKDSDVLLRLAQIADIKHLPIYKSGIDPAGSIRHAREVGAVVVRPKTPFFKLVEKRGFPTRRARFCCEQIKEYGILPVSAQGIRRSESKARTERYHEPQICRVYGAKDKVRVYLPILEWTDDDVAEFIASEGIKVHPLYYDEEGNFHVERRCGCLCCPLQSQRKLREDFAKQPLMVKAYIKHGKVWWDKHPDARSHVNFTCIEDILYHNIFCNTYQDYVYKKYTLFGELDTKAFLEDYFKVELP